MEKRGSCLKSITLDEIRKAEPIGQGGSGVVLRLVHPTAGDLALKRLHASSTNIEKQKRHVLREGQVWQNLQHPHVLPFLGVLNTNNEIFLASPYTSNGSLDHYLLKNPGADRLRLLAETASAIAYLHRERIIHGDIKATNILVSNDVHALLCDFGLSRFLEDPTSITGQGAGTLRLQSPELLANGSGKTFHSDVWAFGMTIYQILSGKVPLHEYSTPYALTKAIVDNGVLPETKPSRSPDGLSYQPVWNVAVRCWERDPNKRPSMDENHQQLEAARHLPRHQDLSSTSAPGHGNSIRATEVKETTKPTNKRNAVFEGSLGVDPRKSSGIALKAPSPPKVDPPCDPSPDLPISAGKHDVAEAPLEQESGPVAGGKPAAPAASFLNVDPDKTLLGGRTSLDDDHTRFNTPPASDDNTVTGKTIQPPSKENIASSAAVLVANHDDFEEAVTQANHALPTEEDDVPEEEMGTDQLFDGKLGEGDDGKKRTGKGRGRNRGRRKGKGPR